jgi:oxygen-independent coproporphyrinogen III oxidase
MHVYVHVPFCARRCTYCDFAIAVRRRVPAEEWAGLVLDELALQAGAGRWDGGAPLATVYFGGGTPSLVGPAAVARVLDRLGRDPGLRPDAEVTLEANPEDVTRERAEAWLAAGVNRVSLGVQSFEPAVLEWMHRVHDADAPARAMEALRAAGMTNVSLDLIYGVPISLGRDWSRDLARAIALQPDHVSLYGLTVEPRTPLARWVDRGVAVPAPEGDAAAEYLEAHAALTGAGFRHYEVSNAARPGRESRHNLACWRRAPYLGLGPSAHSASGRRRWWNTREWADWRERMLRGRDPLAGLETLTPAEERLEEVYLGLRTLDGVAASSLPDEAVSGWLAAGWAGQDGRRVVLTAQGWLRLDALVARLP